ncbi:MAG: hypothetical protein FJZ47_16310 [Candidatus Tectomicrobia bacterium]|uniref:Uncharacterized protein n=1 Tax=Tectimicrobiota bacterium TaxID=2528274 RepID=A0A937W1V6_UNCTE|nr:hypothetical protein [Candidatus Tectomicrobia bacterium]
MDTHKINAMLQTSLMPHHCTAKVGDRLHIRLPHIPMTRYTEFLCFEPEKQGDIDCFAEEPPAEEGEGLLLPSEIVGRALRPGRLHIIVNASDSSSGARVSEIEPFSIVIDIQET